MEKQQNGVETTYKFDTKKEHITCCIIDKICTITIQSQERLLKYINGVFDG